AVELLVGGQHSQTCFESLPGLRKRNALHRPWPVESKHNPTRRVCSLSELRRGNQRREVARAVLSDATEDAGQWFLRFDVQNQVSIGDVALWRELDLECLWINALNFDRMRRRSDPFDGRRHPD